MTEAEDTPTTGTTDTIITAGEEDMTATGTTDIMATTKKEVVMTGTWTVVMITTEEGKTTKTTKLGLNPGQILLKTKQAHTKNPLCFDRREIFQ